MILYKFFRNFCFWVKNLKPSCHLLFSCHPNIAISELLQKIIFALTNSFFLEDDWWIVWWFHLYICIRSYCYRLHHKQLLLCSNHDYYSKLSLSKVWCLSKMSDLSKFLIHKPILAMKLHLRQTLYIHNISNTYTPIYKFFLDGTGWIHRYWIYWDRDHLTSW